MAVPIVEKMVTGSMTEKKGGRYLKQRRYVCVSQNGAIYRGEVEAWIGRATPPYVGTRLRPCSAYRCFWFHIPQL